MKETARKIKMFLKTDDPRKAAESIPKDMVSLFLAFPAMTFIIAMAVEFFKCLFFHNGYRTDILWINCGVTITGLLAATAYFFKLRYGTTTDDLSIYKNPAVICFSALIFLMFLSTIRNGFSEEALLGDIYRHETLGSFLIYPAVYYFVTSLIDSEQVKRRLINGFLAASFLIAAATLLYIIASEHELVFLSSLTDAFGAFGIVGIYYNTNHYGYSLVIAITLSGAMFVSAEKALSQMLYLLAFILFNVVLIFNDTFGAYLAVLTTLVFLIVLFRIKDKKRNLKTFILLGVFIAVSLVVNFKAVLVNILSLFTDIKLVIDSSPDASFAGSSRWRLWKSTFQMISERPLLGYGVEGIGARLAAEAGNDRPHNEFLQYAAFFGIPALICYVGAIASVFLSSWKRRFEVSPCTIAALAAAFGYLASSCFGNTMYYTAPLFFIVLGMADTYLSKPLR